MLLSACAPSIAPIASDGLICESWREVTTVNGDKLTEKTAQRIEGNNEARLSRGCPPDPARAAKGKAPKSAPAKTAATS